MKSYKSVAGRYLSKTKRRTALTVFGIVMSVALMTAIYTMFYSIDMTTVEMERSEKDYHVLFSDLSKEKAEKIGARAEVDVYGTVCELGYAQLTEFSPELQNYLGAQYLKLDVKAYDNDAFKRLPIKLSEGIMPQNGDEIVIEAWALKQIKPSKKVGDSITLDLSKGFDNVQSEPKSRIFKITGIIEDRAGISARAVCSAITIQSSNDEGTYSIPLRIKKGVNLDRFLVQMKSENYSGLSLSEDQIDKFIQVNKRLISLEGITGKSSYADQFIMVGAFLSILIALATVSVIYNSFHISVIERLNQFGLLRCIGATPAQIRTLILREAGIMAVIGIPLGIICGLLAVKVVLWAISFMQNSLSDFITMHVTWIVIVLGAVVGVITVFISAYLPARKAGKVSPVEAVTGSNIFSLDEVKKVKHAWLSKRVLGLSGMLARKNLSRNKKRLRTTVFSMSISIVLFIVFYGYSDMLMNANVKYNSMPEYSIWLNASDKQPLSTQNLINIKNLQGIENVTTLRQDFIPTIIDSRAFIDRDKSTEYITEFCYVYSLADSEIIKLGFDPKSLNNGKKVQADMLLMLNLS